jgi:hypothetical protein
MTAENDKFPEWAREEREYYPDKEFVIVLRKPHDRMSTYRVQVHTRKSKDRPQIAKTDKKSHPQQND